MALTDFLSGVSNFANNYISPISNTVSTLYSAFGGGQQGGLLGIGGSIYNNYQNNQAINQAVNALRDTSTQNLQTLRGVYDQGMQVAQPYNQAGQAGLTGYQNLLQDPSQITNDPGYQFRLNQGSEAIRRDMAAAGLRGSGNEAIALTEYGQNYATSELDKALSRYTPLVNAGTAGLGATADLGRNFAYGTVGVNDTLGSSIAGGALANAGSRTGFLSDLLNMPNSQTQQGGINLPSNPSNAINNLSNLLGGGNAAAGAGALNGLGAISNGSVGGVGGFGSNLGAAGLGGVGIGTAGLAGTGSTALSGAALGGGGFGSGLGSASLGGTGIGGAGSAIGQGAIGGGSTFGAGIGSGVGGASTGTAASSIGLGPALGIGGGIIAVGKLLQNISGGARESAKEGKYLQEIQRRAQSDPSGQSTVQFMSDIAENRQWPNEGNGWVLGNAIDRGIITADFPNLHSSQSVVDLWSMNPDTLMHKPYMEEDNDGDKYFKSGTNLDRRTQNMADVGAKALAQTYGLSDAQQEQYAALLKNYNDAVDATVGDERWLSNAWTPNDMGGWRDPDVSQFVSGQKAALDSFVNQYMTEPRRKLYAQGLHDQLRSQGYQGDLSKLEAYIG